MQQSRQRSRSPAASFDKICTGNFWCFEHNVFFSISFVLQVLTAAGGAVDHLPRVCGATTAENSSVTVRYVYGMWPRKRTCSTYYSCSYYSTWHNEVWSACTLGIDVWSPSSVTVQRLPVLQYGHPTSRRPEAIQAAGEALCIYICYHDKM